EQTRQPERKREGSTRTVCAFAERTIPSERLFETGAFERYVEPFWHAERPSCGKACRIPCRGSRTFRGNSANNAGGEQFSPWGDGAIESPDACSAEGACSAQDWRTDRARESVL